MVPVLFMKKYSAPVVSDLASLSPLEEFYFQWHLTDQCNLRCLHCYQDNYRAKSELPLVQLEKIAGKFQAALGKWNCQGRIALTGGEPLLHPDFFPLLSRLREMPEVGKISVLTNGTLLTEEAVARFKECPKLQFIQISLDGASPETHDKVRGKGNFALTLSAVRLLARNNIPVRIMSTIRLDDVPDIAHLIDLAAGEGVEAITFERLVPEGHASRMKDALLPSEKVKEIFQYIARRSREEKEKGSRLTIIKLRTLWALLGCPQTEEETLDFQTRLGAMCSIGIDSLTVLPDATVLPCRRLPLPIGNLIEDSLFKIWYTSPLLWEIRNKNNLKGKCHQCDYIPKCSGCRAIAYAVTGNYLAEDPQCWK